MKQPEVAMDASELLGRAVVSIEGGASLGIVEEVLFDTDKLRVAAIVLAHDDVRLLLPFEAIHGISSDVITVSRMPVVQSDPSSGSYGLTRPLGTIVGLRVVNGDAAYLGEVHSLTIDEASGRLVELAAHSGGILGIGGETTVIPASAIRGIGDEFVTTDASIVAAS